MTIVAWFFVVLLVAGGFVFLWEMRRRRKNRLLLKEFDFHKSFEEGFKKGLVSVNEVRSDLPKFEDWDLDYNEVAMPLPDPWCGHHLYKLDSVQMSKNPDEDTLMFSCKNTPCTATTVIDRAVFWKGRASKEAYVDPEWLENYKAHIYNENMRSFERAMNQPLLYIPPTSWECK